MKKIVFFLFILSLLLGSKISNAALLDQPFGGRVTMYPTPGITCATGFGAFSIIPSGVSTAGPYLIPFTNAPITGISLSPGQWILGLYRPIPLPGGCVTTTTPPTPVPTYEVKRQFQTSGFSL